MKPIGNILEKENKNNLAENAKRIPHRYKVGDKVLLRRGTENKYEMPYARF